MRDLSRRLLIIALAGLAATAATLAAGWFVGRARLGPDAIATGTRIEADLRLRVAEMRGSLDRATAAVADPALVTRAIGQDKAAARMLFARAAAALAAREGPTALTVYPEGNPTPLAWAGRPVALPDGSQDGGRVRFALVEGPGTRLVSRTTLFDGDRRIATIVVERTFDVVVAPRAAGANEPAGWTRVRTALAPVAIASARRAIPSGGFRLFDPDGRPLLAAVIRPSDVQRARDRWATATGSIAGIVAAVALLLLVIPLLDWRARVTARGRATAVTLAAAAILVAARGMLRWASPADWIDRPLLSSTAYGSPLLAPLLGSPLGFLATALVAVALIGLVLGPFARWQRTGQAHRARLAGWPLVAYLLVQAAAGVALLLLVEAECALIANTVVHTRLDLLAVWRYADDGARLALESGLVLAHAGAAALGVIILRTALVPWCAARRPALRAVTSGLWLLPLAAAAVLPGGTLRSAAAVLAPGVVIVACARRAPRWFARLRHGTPARRMALLALALLVPACAFYPALVNAVTSDRARLIETRLAPEARNQRQTVQRALSESLATIDARTDLRGLAAETAESPRTAVPADAAYAAWQGTALAAYPLTSSIEIYDPSGTLVSRFAFNLPEDLTATPRADERSCTWDIYEEVAPFFAEERRALHAGRAICDARGRPGGAIVVHAILDYQNLPFIASGGPYLEALRPDDAGLSRDGSGSGDDVAFAFYGWSGRPLFTSGDRAWRLDPDVLARLTASRDPFWARLSRGDAASDVYLLSDRGGIYALGVPVLGVTGYLIGLAELTILCLGVFAILLAGWTVLAGIGGRPHSRPRLLDDIRASFSRTLLLAFTLTVILPVVAVAVMTRTIVAEQLRANVEQDARETVAMAQRVVEDLMAPRMGEGRPPLDDNLLVWVSRLIDQDVNVFIGSRLVATSERDLFASGRLPTRTPADQYAALVLDRQASAVTRETLDPVGSYLLAGTALTAIGDDAMLTVPMASQEQAIEGQIDALDRRVLLGALLFIIAGAALGSSMAARISGPVSRLTRATRRLARGDLDVQVTAATTSSDEMRRLVEHFNAMAVDLRVQRAERERTQRLEAWAEMARQVAHEIKNPLTPIQLNAEHLRRVHADRGAPLGRMLDACVATILGQVHLLRRIASEFSNFGSAPVPQAVPLDVLALIDDVTSPYRAAADSGVAFEISVPDDLPPAHADRTLITRALVNLIENALHAMPGGGRVGIRAWADTSRIHIAIVDSGSGMDADALARAFEPYFSTRTGGTGLGLPIARRNVEASGGTLTISSAPGSGTIAEVTVPLISTAPTPIR